MKIINSGPRSKAEEILLKALKRFRKAYKVKMPRPIFVYHDAVAYEFIDLKLIVKVYASNGDRFGCFVGANTYPLSYFPNYASKEDEESKIQLVINCLELWVQNFSPSPHP